MTQDPQDDSAVQTLRCHYHDADLALEFDHAGWARLKINGLTRESSSLDGSTNGVLRLGSPVQTDYEWHEYIEGFVSFEADLIRARLTASQIELASTSVGRKP